MRTLLALSLLLLVVSAASGCSLPDWQPKQPYLGEAQYSSDDYTQDKWVR